MNARWLTPCMLAILLIGQACAARTVSDLDAAELAAAARAAGSFEQSVVLMVKYQACFDDVLGERSVGVSLPLALTVSVDASAVSASASDNTLNVSAPALSVAASFPEHATDSDSSEGKLNLAESRMLMPRLVTHFEALRDFYAAEPLPADIYAEVQQRVSEAALASLDAGFDAPPVVTIAGPTPAGAGQMPDVSLCDGTRIVASRAESDDVPRSDGARGAFLFSTSSVKPSSMEYLKDSLGQVLAYRPAQQSTSVDVVGLSVSGGEQEEVLEDGRGSKIIGGSPVQDGQMDWSVAFVNIDTQGNRKNFCGGTVVSENWIATAAHCRITSNSTVVLKRKKLNSSDGHERKVKTVWRHIDFGKAANFDSDIALVELTADADAPEIAVRTTAVGVDEDVRVVGWGAQQVGSGSIEEMHGVDLKTVRNTTCKSFYRDEPNKVTDNMVCALEKDADACQGDSGSGLFYEPSEDRFELIGIVSFGKGCADAAYPGVYTATHRFTNWIDTVQTATNISGEMQ